MEASYDDHFSVPARYIAHGNEIVGGVRIEEAYSNGYWLLFDELTFDAGNVLSSRTQGAGRNDVLLKPITGNATLLPKDGTTFNMTTFSDGKSFIILTDVQSDNNHHAIGCDHVRCDGNPSAGDYFLIHDINLMRVAP